MAMKRLSSTLSKCAEYFAAACAYAYLLCTTRRIDVRYRVARDEQAFRKIGRLRRDVYQTARSSYLLGELDEGGLDGFDRNAVSFLAEDRNGGGDIFAAVRAVRHPFEILQFVSEEFLAGSLGHQIHFRTVEVSRLVSARPNRVLTNGLFLFGGVYVALHGVTRYFAYVAMPDEAAPRKSYFEIPHRNRTGYCIISGSIAKHAASVGPRLWRGVKSAIPAETVRADRRSGPEAPTRTPPIGQQSFTRDT